MTQVEIGTAVVSYIEPHPGQAVAFNRWYERDHFPAAVKAGPGVFAGARFVATRSCKELRPPSGRLLGDPARGSYLGLAWVLPGKQPEWDAWVAREMDTIAAQGRLFAGRDHVHTAVYTWTAGTGAVDPVVALDRGAAGAIVVAGAPGLAVEAVLPASGLLAAVRFRLERTIISEADPPAHDLVVGLYESDPRAAFRDLSPHLGEYGFASPFLATIPGTDEYAADL